MNKPLSELSFDTANNITVCNYKNEFVDFDNLKGILKRNNIPNSPDMVYINDEKKEIWFVEFKSSNKRNLSNFKNKIKLKRKILSALFLLYEIYCEKSCEYKNYNKFYFVVFNKNETLSFEDEFLDISNKDDKRMIEFGLDDLKPNFLKDIFTDNCDSFIKLFSNRFKIQFENN